MLVTGMVNAWASRLGSYLLRRILRDGKDRRFNGVRDNPPKFLVFWAVQARSQQQRNAWRLQLDSCTWRCGPTATVSCRSSGAVGLDHRNASVAREQISGPAASRGAGCSRRGVSHRPDAGRQNQLSVNMKSVPKFDAAGAALWAVGLLVEAIADGQKATFKKDPRNKGRAARVLLV